MYALTFLSASKNKTVIYSITWWLLHSYICSCHTLHGKFVKKSFVCDTITFLVNCWENEKSISETRTVMSGVGAYQTFISWMSSLIDVYNQAIGHIIQKNQSFLADSLIQILYESHTIQSTHEKTSSCNKSTYAFSESKKLGITRNHERAKGLWCKVWENVKASIMFILWHKSYKI